MQQENVLQKETYNLMTKDITQCNGKKVIYRPDNFNW